MRRFGSDTCVARGIAVGGRLRIISGVVVLSSQHDNENNHADHDHDGKGDN